MPAHANRLPSLLSRLPKDGLHSVVRLMSKPSTLYLITARHLKYRPVGGSYSNPARSDVSDPAVPAASASGSSSADDTTSSSAGQGINARPKHPSEANKRGLLKQRPASLRGSAAGSDPDSPLLVGGRIWAMRFDASGRWVKPRPTQQAAQPISSTIRLKKAWEPVPDTALTPETRERLGKWQELQKRWTSKVRGLLQERAREQKPKKVEGKIRWMERTRRAALRGEQLLRPTIIYKDATVHAGQVVRGKARKALV